MKISKLASPSVTAWIVALATVGAVALVPSSPAPDELRVARPPLADVTVVAPGIRPAGSAGSDDMLRFLDAEHEDPGDEGEDEFARARIGTGGGSGR